MNPTNHIFAHTPDSLRQWCDQRGMPHFRAAQILEWVYRKNTVDPAAMTNLSARERQLLAAEMTFLSGRTIAHQSATDGTQKLLIEWDDAAPAADPPSSPIGGGGIDAPRVDDGGGSRSMPASLPLFPIRDSRLATPAPPTPDSPLPTPRSSRQTECVMIPSTDPTGLRRTACISSQVGCPVGCRFCASGLGGLDGNLSSGRIVEQVWRLAQLDGVHRITNVVFMGMGEPLANLSNVIPAIRTIAAEWGLGISARKITISTVGLPAAIRKLAEQLDLPVTLALSLHAPTDEIRRQLIPWAEYTTIADLLAACRAWFEKTGREITLEYTLLRAVNDRPEHAEQLATLAKSLRANVNLIRYNEVAGLPFKRPRTDDVIEFQRLLRARNINAHIRRSRGRDIAAACGQLRHEKAAS